MKTIVNIIAILAFVAGMVSPAQAWVAKQSGPSDIVFTSPSNAYGISVQKFLKSTDGGESWIEKSTFVNEPASINFYDQNLGLVTFFNGSIMKTTNAGLTWFVIWNSGATLLDVCFRDSLFYVACGGNGTILRTTNGGINWIDNSPNLNAVLSKIVYVNGKYFVSSNRREDAVFTSVDAINWSSQSVNATRNLGVGTNGSNVYLAGGSDSLAVGTITRSTNNGATWITSTFGTLRVFTDISFANSNVGFAIAVTTATGPSYIYKTYDAGASWQLDTTIQGEARDVECTATKVIVTTFDGIHYIKSITVGVHNNGTTVPTLYSLGQNYPNPFNPSTKVNFSIPKSGMVKLSVFDMAGKEVAVLFNEALLAGNFTADFNASALTSGIYFYRLQSGTFVETKKMALVK